MPGDDVPGICRAPAEYYVPCRFTVLVGDKLHPVKRKVLKKPAHGSEEDQRFDEGDGSKYLRCKRLKVHKSLQQEDDNHHASGKQQRAIGYRPTEQSSQCAEPWSRRGYFGSTATRQNTNHGWTKLA